MTPKQELYIFNELLNRFARGTIFTGILNTFKDKQYLETFQQTSKICAEDADYSSEEKWFALYIRRLTSNKLVESAENDAERQMYHDYLLQDGMLLKYHSVLFADNKETVAFTSTAAVQPPNAAAVGVNQSGDVAATGITEEETAQQSSKDKEKAILLEQMLKKADELYEAKDFEAAAQAYQHAIRSGATSWDVYTKCLVAFVAIENHQEVIKISKAIIKGVGKEEDSVQDKDVLCLAHVKCGHAHALLKEHVPSFDSAYHHFKMAERYHGAISLAVINTGLALVANLRMYHFRFDAENITRVQRSFNRKMTEKYATEAYARQLSILDGNTDNSEKTEDDLFTDRVRLSESSFLAGDYANSLIHLIELIKIKPNNIHAYKHLAASYCSIGDYTKAIENFKIAISKINAIQKLTPTNIELRSKLHFYMGVCMLHANLKTDALNAFMQSMFDGQLNKHAVLGMMLIGGTESTEIVNKVKVMFKSTFDALYQDFDTLFSRSDEGFIYSFTLCLKGFMLIKNKKLSEAVDCYAEASEYFPLTPQNQLTYDKAKVLLRSKTDIKALNEFGVLAKIPVVSNQAGTAPGHAATAYNGKPN
jgi:tetratricopeptide (TPR) repeat protein